MLDRDTNRKKYTCIFMFPNVIEVVLCKIFQLTKCKTLVIFRAIAALSLVMAKNRYLNQYCNLDIRVKLYKTKE